VPESEPAWLAAKVDQRLALMEEHMGDVSKLPTHFVMTPLTEPEENASKEEFDHWERTCDNCGVYCPWPTDFYTGTTVRMRGETQVIFTFGVCATCKKLGEEQP